MKYWARMAEGHECLISLHYEFCTNNEWCNSKCKRFLCSATALLFDFWNLIDVKKIVTNSLEITLLHNYWIKFQESNCNDDCSGITASWMPARKIRCSLYQFIVRQFPLLLIFSWFNLSHILLKPKLIKGQAFEPLFLLY